METINKIELRGTVGAVQRYLYQGMTSETATFSLKTTREIKPGDDGEPYTESEWHSCTAHKNADNNLDLIVKGKLLHIIGRLRYDCYGTKDGLDKFIPEVWVTRIHKTEE